MLIRRYYRFTHFGVFPCSKEVLEFFKTENIWLFFIFILHLKWGWFMGAVYKVIFFKYFAFLMSWRINTEFIQMALVTFQNFIKPLLFILNGQNIIVLNTYLHTHIFTHACSKFIHRMKTLRDFLYFSISKNLFGFKWVNIILFTYPFIYQFFRQMFSLG